MKAKAAPILMYHRIGVPRRDSIVRGQYVVPGQFEKHLRFLRRRGYSPMHLTEYMRALDETDLDVKPIAITFDDGYRSFYTEALPILDRMRATATVFMVTGRIGGNNDWDIAKGDVTEPLMTVDQLVDAHRRGIEIGSHSLTHADLPACAESEAKMEVCESKARLESVLNTEVDWFSYPYGRENEAIRSLIRSAGYRGACGTRRALNDSRSDPYSLARINIRATTSVLWLHYKLLRARKELR